MENKFNIGDFVSYFENDKELNDESFIHKLKNMHNGYRLEEIVNGKICQIIFDEDKPFNINLNFMMNMEIRLEQKSEMKMNCSNQMKNVC